MLTYNHNFAISASKIHVCYRVVNNDRVSELFSFAIWNSEWLVLYATFTTIGILRGIQLWTLRTIRVVRCVLSAKNHELGYSIIINNSVMYVYCIGCPGRHGRSLEYMMISYLALLFWYLVKSDLSSVRYYNGVHWASHFLQGTRKTRSLYNDIIACKDNCRIVFA